MSITPSDPVTITTSADTWIEFKVTDMAGAPVAGLTLGDFVCWYAKQNAATLASKALTPGTNLSEVGRGVYRILFTAAELDTIGLFLFVVEVTGNAQTAAFANVVREAGVGGGIQQNSESWLPYRAASGIVSTGTTGISTLDAVQYKKSDASVMTTKTITPVTDLRELGRGLYSIRFTTTELDTLGSFTYAVAKTGSDLFLQFMIVVAGGSNKYEFVLEDSGSPMAGVYIDIREKNTLTLVGTVQTGADGKANAYIPLGDFIATLRDGSKVFTANNHAFSVSAQAPANCLELDVEYITSTLAASAVGKSTGSATLHNVAGEPLPNKVIRVVAKLPQLQGGILYLYKKDLVTDQNGMVSYDFVQGITIAVSVEGTNLFREFEVPVTAFNLISELMAVDDPFTIQTPTFQTAPVHSP